MTIGDKCPYCGRELLSGYLQSARQIIWSQEEKSISFRADEDGDLVVSHGIWEGSFADCRYCADCGIFLLERPAQPPKFGERLRGKFGRLRHPSGADLPRADRPNLTVRRPVRRALQRQLRETQGGTV